MVTDAWSDDEYGPRSHGGRDDAVDRSAALPLIAVILAAYGVYTALYVPGMMIGPPAPLLLICFIAQAVFAIAAAVGLWTRQSWAAVLVLLLGASIAATQLVEILLGISPLRAGSSRAGDRQRAAGRLRESPPGRLSGQPPSFGRAAGKAGDLPRTLPHPAWFCQQCATSACGRSGRELTQRLSMAIDFTLGPELEKIDCGCASSSTRS
jgi:hypothetical protein